MLYLGNAVVDLVLPIPHLPTSGADVVAASSRLVAGGGVNAMVAAARAGMSVTYGGGHGTGPLGDLVRASLAAAGISVAQKPTPGVDTGLVVALIEPDGERGFVTTFGAEGRLTPEQLDGLTADVVFLTGYGLYVNAQVLLAWLAHHPGIAVFFDPGPLGSQLPAAVLDEVLVRSTWCSVNVDEAAALTGQHDPSLAAQALAERTAQGTVLVRTGKHGCVVVEPGAAAIVVAAPVVTAIDTSGAGDVHSGVFLAAVGSGVDVLTAARAANVAAAHSVTKAGPGSD